MAWNNFWSNQTTNPAKAWLEASRLHEWGGLVKDQARADVAADAADPGTALGGHLGGTYARVGIVPTFGALGSLKRSLTDGRTTAIQVYGDSTSNEVTEWPGLLLDALAADHPEHTVQHLLWSDATQDYARVPVQTGTAGVAYQVCDGSDSARRYPIDHIAGTIDCRVKIRATDYTPAENHMLIGAMTAGSRSWALGLSTSGSLRFIYSTDGTNIGVMASTAVVGIVDGTDAWLRCVFTPDDGAGNRAALFYKSTDGVTWTQVGNTVTTSGAVTLHVPPAADGYRLGGTSAGVYRPFVGRIYEVEIRSGASGPLTTPALPALWSDGSAVTVSPVVGAPVLTLVNGSHAGANIAYLGDATRLPKMAPDYGQSVVILSDSLNESRRTGAEFLSTYQGWMDAIRARTPYGPPLILTQNPMHPGNATAPSHATRRVNLLALSAATRTGAVDTYQAFLDYGEGWESALMTDTVHPNSAGQALWAEAIINAYNAS